MADKPIIGTYGLLIKSASTFIPMVCQIDLSFDRTRDVIRTVTKCGATKRPNPFPDYEISGTAQLVLSSDGTPFTNKASEEAIDQLFQDATEFDWQIGPLDGTPVPGDVVYAGKGFFSDLSTSYPTEEEATFDFTLAVIGNYTKTVEPVEP